MSLSPSAVSRGEVPDGPLAFTLPVLTVQLPAPRLHPAARQETRRTADWCRTHLRCILPDDDALDLFIAEHAECFALWCYPDAPLERLGLITDLMQFFGAVDNVLDDVRATDRTGSATRALLEPVLDALKSGPSDDATRTGPDVLRELLDLMGRLHQHLSPRQGERLLHALSEYADGCVQEDGLRAAGTVPDFDTYQQVHAGTSFRGLVMVLIEYALGIDVSSALATCPALQATVDVAIRHVLLVNDLFSYRREHFHGDASINPITIFLQQPGENLQGAVDRLGSLILDAERDLYDARAATLASPAATEPAVVAFLEGLETFCSGYLRSVYLAGRYNGVGHTWNGLTSGTVVLHPDRTEYLP
ncbi:terpene synthase family protein [Streptomyces sp. NPDC004050]